MKGNLPFMKNLFIVILNYKEPLDKVNSIREEHLDFIRGYVNQGKFLTAGRQTPPLGGVVVAHNTHKEELESILKKDPYYTNGLADHTIIEFTPGLYSNGLEEYLKNLDSHI